MATTIANLKTVLSADAAQFNKTLDDTNARLGKLQSLATDALGAFGIGLGAGAVVSFLQSSIKEAEEAAQANAKLRTALDATGNQAGLTAQQLTDYAQQLSASTAIQDDVIVGAEAMLVSFGNIRGEILKRAIPAVLDFAKFTGTDAASAARILGKALSDPADALGALSKAGVVFTDEQKAAIKAMVEAGDVAGAQALVIDKLGASFGGAAERMATASERLQTALADLKQEIGGFGGGVGGKGGLVDFIAGSIGKWTIVVKTLSETVGLLGDLNELLHQQARIHIPWLAQAEKIATLIGEKLSIQAPAADLTVQDTPLGREMTASMKKQANAAGQSADSMKMLQEATKLYEREMRELEAAQQAAANAIDATLSRLEESFDTTGMSAAGIAAYRLQLQGASDDEIAYAMGVVNATEELKKFLNEFSTIESSGIADAFEEATQDIQALTDALIEGRIEFDAYNVAVDKLGDALDKKLKSEGKRLHDSLRTPLEKAEDDIRDLNTLLEHEAITAEDYQRRLEQIQDTLRAPEMDVFDTSNPALEFGTAAAFSASRASGMERREVEDAKTHDKLEDIKTLLARIEQASRDGGKTVVKLF